MPRGYSKGRGGHIGSLVSQKFLDRDPASVTRGGATIQAASSVDETVSTFTSSVTLTLKSAIESDLEPMALAVAVVGVSSLKLVIL